MGHRIARGPGVNGSWRATTSFWGSTPGNGSQRSGAIASLLFHSPLADSNSVYSDGVASLGELVNPAPEILRLQDLMPASGRMLTKIVSQPAQTTVIDAPFPVPWRRDRPIYINFDYWKQLSRPQRDLLLLRTVCWLIDIKWFKPNVYQALVVVGLVGTGSELFQSDLVGIVVSGGLTALAAMQLWRKYRRHSLELSADEAALKVAERRGYDRLEAARHLEAAIETVPRIEGRTGMSFAELVRCQNLRAIADLSAAAVPETVRRS